MPNIGANSIRAGNILNYNGKLWIVSKTPEHTMPGKGGAFVQVEMKDIRTGTKLNERFRSAESVDRVTLEQKDHQFLYAEGDMLTLMDLESYEQLSVNKELAGDAAVFLQDGMKVMVESYEGMVLSIALPDTVILTISEADPVVKGQTATSSYKPAVLENGVRVMVPPFIESGIRIVVKTEDGSYVERAK